MNELKFLNRQAQVLEHVHLHWEELHEEQAQARRSASLPLTIALSRQAGTPAAEVAGEVGRRLGWPVYDEELPRRVAHELGLDVRQLERFDERRQSWLLECIESLAAAPNVSESIYVLRLVKVIQSLGAKGNCILVDRGAAYILPPRSTLCVRLVGAREDRAAALARRLGLTHREAERKVDELDRERASFIRDHFRRDPLDPLNFDLILNTSHLSPRACASQIVEALHQREAEPGVASPAPDAVATGNVR